MFQLRWQKFCGEAAIWIGDGFTVSVWAADMNYSYGFASGCLIIFL
jgi:hypothetical protein